MTYPTQAVADTINEYLIPIQVNTQDDSGATLVERYRQVWTPDIRILDNDGYELYRWNGYLPPFEYVPQLLAGVGQAYLRKHDEPKAASVFERVIREYPTSAVAPEAEYYYAVSKYKQSHKPEDLMGNWDRLRRDHPESIWRVRQSFSENRS